MIKCALQFEIFTILNCLQLSIKLNQIKCWFLERGETSRSRVENQQTQSTYDAESGNRTRDTLVEGERSHHYANPAPRKPDTSQKKTKQKKKTIQTLNLRHACTTFHMTCPMLIIDWTIWTHWQFPLAEEHMQNL